jgi:spermidine synthase
MKHVLFIGAGGGIGPRTFHETDPDLLIDVVDIDGRVLEIARDFFFMPDHPNIRTFAEDGRMFVQASAGGYDCIILDAFTIGGRIPFHLTTLEAFELCRDRLAPGGVFIMNTNSAIAGSKGEIFRSIGKTLREVFPGVQALAAGWRYDSTATTTRNVLFVASRDESGPSAAEWRDLAASFVARSSVSNATMGTMVQDLVEPWPNVASAPLLTDDHAPIETMGF